MHFTVYWSHFNKNVYFFLMFYNTYLYPKSLNILTQKAKLMSTAKVKVFCYTIGCLPRIQEGWHPQKAVNTILSAHCTAFTVLKPPYIPRHRSKNLTKAYKCNWIYSMDSLFGLFPPMLNCELLSENRLYETNDAFFFLTPHFPKAHPI